MSPLRYTAILSEMPRMIIIATAELTSQQLEHVKDLAQRVDNQAKMYWSILEQTRPQTSMFLIYHEQQLQAFMTFFLFDRVEGLLLIDSQSNQREIFTALESEITSQLDCSELFPCLFSNQHGKNPPYTNSIFSHSEFNMRRSKKNQEQYEPSPIVFRQATELDIDTIITMDRACFSSPSLSLESRIHSILVDTDYYIGIAGFKGQTIGKIHLQFTDNKATIYDFAILPAFQGQGLGSIVLKQAINLCLIKGIELIELDVESENKNAVKLYEKSGFDVIIGYDFWQVAQFQMLYP